MSMASLDPQSSMILAGVILTALIAVGAWLTYRNHQSHHLQERFGPEYKRAMDDHGSRTKAEAELLEREKRVSKFNIVALSRDEADRFGQRWRTVQGRFVDDPKGAVMEADLLVREVMQARGYPMGGDFDRLAADLSVDHPVVVDNYRAAQDIVRRDQRGEADTEALRNAIVHYRALFHDLLDVDEPRADPRPGSLKEAH
jgi:hypothetical protein